MQLLPGVYLINGSPYGRHQNGYLVHTQGAIVLIDSGDLKDAETLPEIERNVARWGFRLEQASHLFITHAHFDHASHAAELQRRGVKLVASPETAEAMAAGDARCVGYAVQRTFEPCQVDALLHDGEEFVVQGLHLRAWSAPGHCNGLLVYEIICNNERVWFTSDIVEPHHAHRGVNLPWTGALDFNRSLYLKSLARLLTLPRCEHLFPGHGPAAIGDGQRLLQMAYVEALTKWR